MAINTLPKLGLLNMFEEVDEPASLNKPFNMFEEVVETAGPATLSKDPTSRATSYIEGSVLSSEVDNIQGMDVEATPCIQNNPLTSLVAFNNSNFSKKVYDALQDPSLKLNASLVNSESDEIVESPILQVLSSDRESSWHKFMALFKSPFVCKVSKPVNSQNSERVQVQGIQSKLFSPTKEDIIYPMAEYKMLDQQNMFEGVEFKRDSQGSLMSVNPQDLIETKVELIAEHNMLGQRNMFEDVTFKRDSQDKLCSITNTTIDNSLTRAQELSLWSSLKGQSAAWNEFSIRDAMRHYVGALGENIQHAYTNITTSIGNKIEKVQDDLTELWQENPLMVVAGGVLVASLIQSAWNKTEIKSVDPVSKEKRIYELVLRANSKRAQLQQKCRKVKRLSTKVLRKTPKASGQSSLQLGKKALMPTHSIMFSPL
jgi:hypothetical protein